MTAKFFIKELDCESCSKAIIKKLNKYDIEDIEFDIMSKHVWINFDESKHSIESLTTLLKKSGFSAKIENDD